MAVAEKSKTTEERLGMIIPPSYQCSDIDKLIKVINWAEKYVTQSTKTDDADELRNHLDDIEYEMNGLESDLEDIRKACEELRDWGQGWKDLAKNMADKNNLDLDDYA